MNIYVFFYFETFYFFNNNNLFTENLKNENKFFNTIDTYNTVREKKEKNKVEDQQKKLEKKLLN